MTINGIDVSNYQGQIDWPSVAGAGISFALIHCVDGLAVDPWFARNWQGAGAAGLARGAYALVYPDLHTPQAAAALCVQTLQPLLAPGDVVALDLEEGTGDLSGWVIAWLAAVERGLGFKPMLYSGPYFLADHNCAGNATLGQYGLWLADWGVAAPTLPAGWSFWAVWQSSAQGAVPGVRGAVDLDQFNGTVEQFRAYGLPQPPAPKQPTNDDLIAMERYLLATPPDMHGLLAYAQPFT